MKVAIVIDSLVGGGAEKVMLTLATELVRQEHTVTILSLANSIEYDIASTIQVAFLFNHRASKVDRFWHKKASIKKLESWFSAEQQNYGEFDVVLSNLDRSNNLLSQSSIKNVHYVIHNSVEGELARQKKLGPFAHLYLKKSKRNLSDKSLICVSKGIEEEITQGNIIEPKFITTIYNPFDIPAIRELAEQENSAIPNSPYLIHVGRLAKQKRHDILFAAFAQLDKRYKLVLLCNKPAKALKLAQQYGIAEQLVLPGFQQNPYQWIKRADALVLSSDFEGLPTVLIEALAVGTAVVSTDCNHGPKEILTNALAKYLVPIQSPDELANAIEQVHRDKPNVLDADILKKVTAEPVVKQYLKLAS
ncbi:MAG: glycosyltransferase [Pseudoalteromonas sp.]|uniref:glycosyltransferase n=2 Tax=Pseudoalteromonas TaxID=53246 RepID=UPI003F9DA9A2